MAAGRVVQPHRPPDNRRACHRCSPPGGSGSAARETDTPALCRGPAIPLELDGQPASTRDGRLRAAVAELLRLATAHDCRLLTVENLDFADARRTGRETLGRGTRGRHFRRIVSGIPTGQFRDLLVGMAANAGLWIIAADPAWTSVWGGRYWQQPLSRSTRQPVTVSRHHAAALVIGRRGLGHRARRRGGHAPTSPEDGRGRATDSGGQAMTTGAAEVAPMVVPEPTNQGPGGPGGQRAGQRPTRPARPNRIPPATRRPRTVRGHPSAPTDRR